MNCSIFSIINVMEKYFKIIELFQFGKSFADSLEIMPNNPTYKLNPIGSQFPIRQ